MLLPITPALSPDGSELVFSWENDLWKISTDSNQDTPALRLTSHPAKEYNPIFSKDGKTIYFNTDMEGSTQVYSMPLDKSSIPKQITFHSVENILEDLTIANNSERVIYRSARDTAGSNPYRVYINSVSGIEKDQMLFNAYCHSVKMSPDGSKVLITREGAHSYRTGYYGAQAIQTWIYDIAKKSFSQPVSSNFGCHSPLWMPDGSGFYYISGSGGHFNLWKHNLKSTKSTQLTHYEDANVMSPCISSDGSTIIYRHLFHYYKFDTKSKNSEKLELHHNLSLIGDKPQKITITETEDADFSPSGLEIVFSANGDIFAMDTVLREPIQLTNSPEFETNIFFGDDGKAIYYLSDDGIKTSINMLTKVDPNHFWWEISYVTTSTLIEQEKNSTIKSFIPSPDGKTIGYSTTDGKVFVYNLASKKNRLIAQSWNQISFKWSPDSRWITYALENNNFNSDIYIARADGSEKPVNVTKHPDNEFAPIFSPDGKKLAFLGKRNGPKFDPYYVNLTPNGSERTAREKKIQMAKKVMKKDPSYAVSVARWKSIFDKIHLIKPRQVEEIEDENENENELPELNHQADIDANEKPSEPEQTTEATQPATRPESPIAPENKKDSYLSYDLVDIQTRIQRIPLNGRSIKNLFWKHDSSALLIQSKLWNNDTYEYDLDDDDLSKYVDYSGKPIRYDAEGNLFWISNKIPSVLKGEKSTSFKFIAQTEFNRTDHQRYKFRHIWRTTRDTFYDETMNGLNWDNMLVKYEEAAVLAKSSKTFDRIVTMMLGELNASHTGYYGIDTKIWSKQLPWSEEMLHLGVHFDSKENGWLVTKIMTDSPATNHDSKLNVGDVITKINGIIVNDKTLNKDVLWGQRKHFLELTLLDPQGAERIVNLRPISYRKAAELASDDLIRENKNKVENLSKGKFGYIHLAKMQWDDFRQFEQHLYENGDGKDGIIIDVRDNGGGFTTDHLLTALTQPRHAYTIPRNGGLGYPQDRSVYATWQKPIVVLCNQNSFSNSEIFAHAIKTLNRGKLVGTPTAGGVISTSSENILGEGDLRIPFRGWFHSETGEDMELDGASPNPEHIVWAKPGDIESGIDKQLEKAVSVLSLEVKSKKEHSITPKYRNRNDPKGLK